MPAPAAQIHRIIWTLALNAFHAFDPEDDPTEALQPIVDKALSDLSSSIRQLQTDPFNRPT